MNLRNLSPLATEAKNLKESVVRTLYALSTKSLLAALVLASILTIALYPVLSQSILIWFGIVLLFTIFRFFDGYHFRKNPQRYTTEIWHIRFIILASISAILFSFVGSVLIHWVDPYYQLFIISVLLGLSAGSTASLSLDMRLTIGYIAILIFPLMLTMLFLSETPLHLILAVSLFLYFIAQVTIIYQINEQRKKIESLQSQHILFHNLFKNSSLSIFVYDNDLKIIDCNAQLGLLFEQKIETLIGLDLRKLPDTKPLVTLTTSLTDGFQSYTGPYTSLSCKKYWIELKAFAFNDNKYVGGIAMIEDKTSEYHAQKELKYMAQHDMLTGLLNRRGFTDHIDKLVNAVKHQSFYSILFYLDLNQFKAINDSLGHAVGDEILLAVSKKLVEKLSHKSMISRIGGDEFVIVMPHICEDEKVAHDQSRSYATQIQEVFQDAFVLEELRLHIKASIGIVLIKPKYMDTLEIMRYADLTMYQAKKETHTHISYYDPSLDKKQKELFLLQHDLSSDNLINELVPYFQPIVEMKSHRLLSAELLIRWEHPTLGLLSPNSFIPLAIKAGLLSKITWWIIDKACRQIVQWKKSGLWKLEYISVNITPQQLLETDFALTFFEKLKNYGLESKDIMLEIIERSLVDNFTNTQGVINTLKQGGVKCAIDDFGIGYSSLSYLKKLSFHTLKIDREFVKDIGTDPKELILMSTILEIGRQFNYHIVIEGIETKAQKDALLSLDENLSYQGYFFSRPVPVSVFTQKFLA